MDFLSIPPPEQEGYIKPKEKCIHNVLPAIYCCTHCMNNEKRAYCMCYSKYAAHTGINGL